MASIKHTASLFVFCFLIVVFSSCGSTLSFDPHELASILATADLYHDPMHAVDDNVARMLYGLSDESVELAVYSGTAATPEAVLVIDCGSEEDAERISEIISDYNTRQINVFESFNTEYQYEAEKAVIEVRESYVIYIVSKDANEAVLLLEKYMDSIK